MQAGTSLNYDLPGISDPDGDSFTVSYSLDSASSFCSFEYPTFTMTPSLKDIGNYSITITIKDANINS